jgi:hypothetical protein
MKEKLFDLVGLGVPFYLGAGHSFLETDVPLNFHPKAIRALAGFDVPQIWT